MAAVASVYAGQGSRGARAYVLGALAVVYTFNFIDRTLIGILQEPIRRAFDLSDAQLGLLGGPAFAILYTLLGVPIAYLAERSNRITIISLGLALWSAATAACGFAGTYLHLLGARVAVGIGEAACTPPSHSAISDYFPSNKRASALAIYSLGIPIGSMFAAAGGGWLAQNYDWRTAFILLGAPGLVLAVMVRLTVREPRRADTRPASTFRETMAALAGKASFWNVAFGGALISLVGYGTAQFQVSYMVRAFGLSIANASYAFALIAGLSAGLGTFLGGYLSDRLAPKRPKVYSWLPVLGVAVALPFYLAALAQTQFWPAFALLFFAPVFHYFYLGPMYAVTQGVAQPRMRATAAAILLLVVNLIGYTLGPLIVGALADFYAGQRLAEDGFALSACAGVQDGVCAESRALGLRYALMTTVCILIWPAYHFWRAGRTLIADRVG